MQELVSHTKSLFHIRSVFNSMHSVDKQIDVTAVSLVSFTGNFPQILQLLQRSSLPIQPSVTPNTVWYISYQFLRYSDLDSGSYPFPDLEIGVWRVWLVDKRCLLILGTWSHLWYIQRSVYSFFYIAIILSLLVLYCTTPVNTFM
jgi:hypothetical protein